MNWNQQQAINLCVIVESICPQYGCHVALTGGLLYKHGERKDCDLLFYRIRQEPVILMWDLFEALEAAGFAEIRGLGWCWKATYEGRNLDLFFPEQEAGEYTEGQKEARAEANREVHEWRYFQALAKAADLWENDQPVFDQ